MRFATTILATVIYVFSGYMTVSAQVGGRPMAVTDRFDNEINAYSTSGTVKLQIREIRIETPGNGERYRGNRIVIIFDPRSGAYSWQIYAEGDAPREASDVINTFGQDRVVYLKDGVLTVFLSQSQPSLSVREYRDRASDLNNAEAKTLSAMKMWNTSPGSLDIASSSLWKCLLLPQLGLEFVVLPMSQTAGMTPKITNVQWDGKHWVVTLSARWTADVTLDSAYNLVSITKVESN